jgi:uncharacterized protein (DUF1684 family)
VTAPIKERGFIMVKKMSFKVGYTAPSAYGKFEPCVRLSGDWLLEMVIKAGDRLELVQGKNMLVLMKAQRAD